MTKLTREAKAKIVEELKEKFLQAKGVIFTDFRGLKVQDLEELRRKMKEKNLEYKVVKNTLIQIALEKANLPIEEGFFKVPLGLGFSSTNEIDLAKVIYYFAKEHEAFKIQGGIIEGRIVDQEEIKALALLPSVEELYVRLIGSIRSPLFRLVNSLSFNLKNLVFLLKNYQETK